jgi:NAD-dependent DNA ligase
MAKDLANFFHHWNALVSASMEDLGRIRGVGQKVAQGIFDSWIKPQNQVQGMDPLAGIPKGRSPLGPEGGTIGTS